MLELDETAKVEDVKEKYHKKNGIAMDRLIFLFEGV